MYVITTRNCSTYLYMPKNANKPAATTNVNAALIFKSMEAAKIFVNNNIPKKSRKQYTISDYWEEVNKISKDNPNIESQIDFNKLTDAMNQLDSILKHSAKYKEYLAAEHSKVEAAINDLYHYIEFKNLGTVRGYRVYKELQSLLKRRRQVKDAEQLMNFVTDENSVNVSGYIAALKSQKDRSYTPRVLTDLFEETE